MKTDVCETVGIWPSRHAMTAYETHLFALMQLRPGRWSFRPPLPPLLDDPSTADVDHLTIDCRGLLGR